MCRGMGCGGGGGGGDKKNYEEINSCDYWNVFWVLMTTTGYVRKIPVQLMS